jgi:hypothetical protein
MVHQLLELQNGLDFMLCAHAFFCYVSAVQLLQFRPADPVARLVAELSQPTGTFDATPATTAMGGAATRGLLAVTARQQWSMSAGNVVVVSDVPLYSGLDLEEPDARVPFQVTRSATR